MLGNSGFHHPVAFTYEADIHCVKCASLRFGKCEAHGETACEEPECDPFADREGNRPYPVFTYELDPGDDNNREVCGTCGDEIS